MPDLINLVTFDEKRGCLTVIEDVLPFDIKRIFTFIMWMILSGAGTGIIKRYKR
jgi:hypothetical protein